MDLVNELIDAMEAAFMEADQYDSPSRVAAGCSGHCHRHSPAALVGLVRWLRSHLDEFLEQQYLDQRRREIAEDPVENATQYGSVEVEWHDGGDEWYEAYSVLYGRGAGLLLDALEAAAQEVER